jgi:hypothetical protein
MSTKDQNHVTAVLASCVGLVVVLLLPDRELDRLFGLTPRSIWLKRDSSPG